MQLELIRAFQELRFPTLTLLFELITSLGSPQFLIVLMPLVFWCGSTRVGFRFLVVVLTAAYTNSLFKELGSSFLTPDGPLYALRPFVAYPQQVWTCRQDPDFDPQALLARLCREEESFAFPSGHAQISFVAWGYLARVVRRRWFSVFAGMWVLLIGLSRVYLGQHWPSDVLGGWVIGAVLLFGAFGLFSLWQHHTTQLNRALLMILAIVTPVLIVLDTDAKYTRAGLLGVLSGAGIGYMLQQRFAAFVVQAPWSTQLAKVGVGLGGIVAIQIGLRLVLPNARLWEVLLGVLTGLWAIYGAPQVFRHMWGGVSDTQLVAQRRESRTD